MDKMNSNQQSLSLFDEKDFVSDVTHTDSLSHDINKKNELHDRASSDWDFADKTRKDTAYITHGYHRYPAKYIPQLARRVIEEHTCAGDFVFDPFCGCGTTLVESIVSGRNSFGSDINPIAALISRAKIEFLPTSQLFMTFAKIKDQLKSAPIDPPSHERIHHWFHQEQINDLSQLLSAIRSVTKDEKERDFFLCGFSHILKNCSLWLQKSTKPTRDRNKKIPSVMASYERHIRLMMRGNARYGKILDDISIKGEASVECIDSRHTSLADNSVNLIVTSPPYITSYEYGDIHQLSMLWLNDLQDLRQFRSQFIGSSAMQDNGQLHNGTGSPLADAICEELNEKKSNKQSEVRIYFQAMYEMWQEALRVVKPDGKVAIVIGDTFLHGVHISNSKVFIEQMTSLGFELIDVIKRRILSKILPSTRDQNTGRFVKATNTNRTDAYPFEYILILRKAYGGALRRAQ